jgi:hypothetical protein
MEALQIIKYRKKKVRLNLMLDWAETMEKLKVDGQMKGDLGNDNLTDSEEREDVLSGLIADSSEDGVKMALAAVELEDEFLDET